MTPPASTRKRPWNAKRERFETPLAQRMQTPARRKALLAALLVGLVGWPVLVLLLGGSDTGAGTAVYLAATAIWIAAVLVLITLSNLAVGGLTTIDPSLLDEREREQRDAAALRSRAVTTVAVFVPVLVAPGLARGGDWVAVQALAHAVFFLHVFSPHVLILWWQRDRPADPDLAHATPETEAPA